MLPAAPALQRIPQGLLHHFSCFCPCPIYAHINGKITTAEVLFLVSATPSFEGELKKISASGTWCDLNNETQSPSLPHSDPCTGSQTASSGPQPGENPGPGVEPERPRLQRNRLPAPHSELPEPRLLSPCLSVFTSLSEGFLFCLTLCFSGDFSRSLPSLALHLQTPWGPPYGTLGSQTPSYLVVQFCKAPSFQ